MTATLVELIDGQLVMSDAEQWRDECLARWVLALPTKSKRIEWLADFEKKHGAAEAAKLRTNVMKAFDKDKA